MATGEGIAWGVTRARRARLDTRGCVTAGFPRENGLKRS